MVHFLEEGAAPSSRLPPDNAAAGTETVRTAFGSGDTAAGPAPQL